jgi:hypothetical protein
MVVIKLVWCCDDGSKTRSGQKGSRSKGMTPWLKQTNPLSRGNQRPYSFQCTYVLE